jgi:geranylgeranyl diphosphate synthase type I
MHSPATVDNLEAALERAVSRFDDGASTGEQMHHHLGFAGGNEPDRRHARLTLAAALEEGGTHADAIDPACAVEIVYQFSLIHEDIEDGGVERAGRPTVWSRYGLAHGINAGDALCAVAYLALLDPIAVRPPSDTVALTLVLHDAHLAMCGGHGRAIAYDRERRISPEEYVAMIDGKTAALYGAACRMGALAAGAAADRAQSYARLGAGYGRALHIADDVNGIWGSGVPAHTGSWTYPVVWALAGPPSVHRERIAGAYAGPQVAPAGALLEVVAALDALGAREAAERAIEADVASADAAADAAGIDGGGRVRAVLQQALRRRPG